jgi:hypothetical protein
MPAMLARTHALGASLLLLLGCSAAPGSPAAGPAPAASSPAPPTPVAAASSGPDTGWSVFDPRAVRCGVDDRPQSVGSLSPGSQGVELRRQQRPLDGLAPTARAPGLDRALLGDRIDPFGITPAGRPAPTAAVRRRPMPPGEFEDIAPPPPAPLHITPGTITLSSGGPLPAPLADAFAARPPQYPACSDLFVARDEGRFQMELTLANTGEPLSVRPTAPGEPSRFQRCLLELSCQLRGRGAPGASGTTSLLVPVETSVERAPPPPSPGQPRGPRVPVTTTLEGARRPGAEALEQAIRDAARDAASDCSASFPLTTRAQVLFTVTVQQGAGRRATASLAGLTTRAVTGAVPPALLSCTVNALVGRSLPPGGQNLRSASVQALVTWNP